MNRDNEPKTPQTGVVKNPSNSNNGLGVSNGIEKRGLFHGGIEYCTSPKHARPPRPGSGSDSGNSGR